MTFLATFNLRITLTNSFTVVVMMQIEDLSSVIVDTVLKNVHVVSESILRRKWTLPMYRIFNDMNL